jgi:predicted AlkP superfamily pyrophosphatase or phosphodiesterase
MLDESSQDCHEFWSGEAPPVLLIALGGFRPEYLNRVQLTRWRSKVQAAAPTLQCLAQSGVSSPYMMPVYPTLTQPNLYSIVTVIPSDPVNIIICS